MSEKFTVEYVLSAIGIPWLRGRALRAARGQERCMRKVRHLHEAIDSFSWGDSEEGGDFWSSVWQWSRGRAPLKGDLPGIPGQEPVRVKRVDSLSLIPNGIGDLAVRRALESQWGTTEGDSDMAGITSSFDFDRTPEGYAFWMEVSRWVVGMSSLPRVPATTDDGDVTATDVLGLLPPDVAKLALANTSSDAGSQSLGESLSLAGAVSCTFAWVSAPEGYSYWSAVHEWAHGRSKMPTAPDASGGRSATDTATNPLTYQQALSMIPDLAIAKKAVSNAKTGGWVTLDSTLPPGTPLSIFVSQAFDWESSPEGHDYWSRVYAWATGDAALARTVAHPELGEVEVVSRGETYATVRNAEGRVRFVKIEELP